jgi:hypothetical protein
LAAVAAEAREEERAAWLLGAAASLHEATGVPLRPNVQASHDRAAAAARTALGEAGFAAAWAAGAALSADAAIAEALAVAPSTLAALQGSTGPAARGGLMPADCISIGRCRPASNRASRRCRPRDGGLR